MSFPLGVIAYPAVVSASSVVPEKKPLRRNSSVVTRPEVLGSSFFKKDGTVPKAKSSKQSSGSHSPRNWSFRSSQKKTSSQSSVSSHEPLCTPSPTQRSSSFQCTHHPASPHDSFELTDSSVQGSNTGRPKYVPIIIPSAYAYVQPEELTPDSITRSYSTHSKPSSPRYHLFPDPCSSHVESNVAQATPRHVGVSIPGLGHPVPEPLSDDLSLSSIEYDLPKFWVQGDRNSTSMSQITPESTRAAAMESNTTQPSQFYANASNEGSNVSLASAYSSQASLVGMRAEYESASEAESTKPDEPVGSQTPSHAQTLPRNASGDTSNLSGLVCNVHRTTGKRPHPLVGAATTVLGDKLYVFGGRRLSRTKTHQLTANLYELDLIRRHWTKVDHKGDIPPPRYFHSVCALGDYKLVCYGGMSPSPLEEGSTETQSEVVVMSDVHIFDVHTLTWTKIATPDAPQGRYAHCATILPSAAIFTSRDAPMSAVHHNPAGTNPNQGSLGVSLDGTGGAEMIIVGGQDSANHYIEQVSIFNLRSLKWSGTTGMGRSCGAYRSVCTPLTSMKVAEIGAGPQSRDDEDDEEEKLPGSGAPMLIYSNYNFLDVRLELQVRLTDGTLIEKPMQLNVSPPGLRFPNGGIIDNHFVVSGTFLTSSKQEYELWALDLRTLAWSRIDAGGSIFKEGSWNKGVLWSRRNAFVVLGDRKRNLVDDYNNRRINFSNICIVELEAFGLYENPWVAEPMSNYVSRSAVSLQPSTESFRKLLSSAAEDLGALALNVRELADMDFLAIDGTRVPVNSRLIARRWGPHFISLLREAIVSASDTDTATLRPSAGSQPSRNSSITITTITPSINSGATTLTNNTGRTELPDTRNAPPAARPRLFYLPHTAPTLHALLHYLYTSTLPAPPHPLAIPQIFCSLLQLARPYKIDGLLEVVVERLHECLDGRNAAAIFNAAAMGAGGGASVRFATSDHQIRESNIPVRTASLAGIDSLLNGSGRSLSSLRIDTDMANGRSTRNTLRPGQGAGDETDDDEVPSSAATDASLSDAEQPLSPRSFTDRPGRAQDIWDGSMSSVVGLQKRGLRGLMEGRRMRERRPDGAEMKVGLGIV